MTYVDSAVLNFTERMCRWFQAWTGRTNASGSHSAQQPQHRCLLVRWWASTCSARICVRVFVAMFCGGCSSLTRTIFKMPIEVSKPRPIDGCQGTPSAPHQGRAPDRVPHAVDRFFSAVVRLHHAAAALRPVDRSAHHSDHGRPLCAGVRPAPAMRGQGQRVASRPRDDTGAERRRADVAVSSEGATGDATPVVVATCRRRPYRLGVRSPCVASSSAWCFAQYLAHGTASRRFSSIGCSSTLHRP